MVSSAGLKVIKIISIGFWMTTFLVAGQEKCPAEEESKQMLTVVRPGSLHSNSIEFLLEPINTSACQGEVAKFQVFFVGNNLTQIIWHKGQVRVNGSVLHGQPITLDGKKFHLVQGEEKDKDDYYLVICDLVLEDAGWYTVELKNNIGSVFRSAFLNVSACNKSDSLPLIAPYKTTTEKPNVRVHEASLLAVFLLLCLVVVVVFCYCRRRKLAVNKPQRSQETVHMNPIYNQIPQPDDIPDVLPPSDPSWEIRQECLQLERLLGEGAFGKVYQGILVFQNIPSWAAIKMLKDDCSYNDRINFVKEIEMMKVIGHHRNVIDFYGYSITSEGHIQVIFEFAKHGNLRDFLRQRRPSHVTDATAKYMMINESGEFSAKGKEMRLSAGGNQDGASSRELTMYDLTSFAFQVARGMEYISLKKIVHRDLAARNVLVAEDLVLKIADFGLTRNMQMRDYYQRTSSGLLPVMWMAPESLADNRYTSKSDVWSFGVLLWEIFTYGDDPHLGVPPEELIDQLLQGHRLAKPVFCSDEMMVVMQRCWDLNPSYRPDFTQLVNLVDRFVRSSTSVEYLSLEHLDGDDISEVFQSDSVPCQLTATSSDISCFHDTMNQQLARSTDSQYDSLSSHRSNSSVCNSIPVSTSKKSDSLLEGDQLTIGSNTVI